LKENEWRYLVIRALLVIIKHGIIDPGNPIDCENYPEISELYNDLDVASEEVMK
jgi:hypothetical protein